MRMTAVSVLALLPTPSLAPLVPRIIRCLDDGFWRVRRAAMEAVAKLPAALLAEHVEAVISRLGHSDGRVREWAVACLGKVYPALVHGAASGGGHGRTGTARTIGRPALAWRASDVPNAPWQVIRLWRARCGTTRAARALGRM